MNAVIESFHHRAGADHAGNLVARGLAGFFLAGGVAGFTNNAFYRGDHFIVVERLSNVIYRS